MKSCDPVDTLMMKKSKLDEDTQGKAVDPTHYRGMVVTLMYLTSSRPDLVYDVCMCARYQACPIEKHLHAVKRIFRYLRGTVSQGLWYSKDYAIALTAFRDADHVSCQDTRHSTSGSMNCRYHFIKEQVENGVIELYFVRLEYQLVDILTRALCQERIEFLINKLGMRSFTAKTLKELADEAKEYKNMNFIATQQAALDNALVPPEKGLKLKDAMPELRSASHKGKKHINLGEHFLQSSIGAFLGKQQDLIDSGNYEIKSCEKSSSRKARKYKKVASPLRKLFPLKEEDPFKKAKRTKRPSKKSTSTPIACVVIRDTYGVSVSKKKAPAKADRSKGIEILSDVSLSEAAQLKEATKRSKQDFHISQASGSGDGTDLLSRVPDEQQRKTSGTDEGTGTKLGVPDVPEYQSESDNESWGDSEDDNDDLNDDDDITNDDDNKGNDDKANIDNDGSDTHDSEKTDSGDDDKNPSFTLKDYDEEEYDEEYESDDDYENLFEEEDDDMYKDVDMRSLRAKHEKERKGDEEMTDADHNVSQEKSYKQVVKDAHVTLTSLQNTKSSKQSSSISSDFASKFFILENVPPTVDEVASMMNSTYEAAASLTEFELKKILLDKMERSESYKTTSKHKELYEVLVKSYNIDKDLFSSYGKAYFLNRDYEDKDKDEDPSAGSDRGWKKRKMSKDVEPPKGLKSKEYMTSSSKGTKSQPKSSNKSVKEEELVFETIDTKMPQDQGGDTEDQPNVERTLLDDWFKKPNKPLTPDHA
uniref:Retrovirus-related Pol polyprotein from transposon TNT 1-94 n=1 Tax=Tanacetum cinerariifolium TaxID=118510 RepID=A0A699GN15_TANCI|nr:hypothetical protein [Tanacetum cinerariifolium]